jgi:hypothetical protein
VGETRQKLYNSKVLAAGIDSRAAGVWECTFYTCFDRMVMVDSEALDHAGSVRSCILFACYRCSVFAAIGMVDSCPGRLGSEE